MSRLEGKVALVTGGNSGIGLASARRLLREGAKVVIVGRRQEGLDEALQQLDGDVLAIRADVSKQDELEQAFAETKRKVGGIDILFVNAGVARFAPLADSTPELYDELFGTNVKGAYFTVRNAAPLLNDGASVIFNSSVAGQLGLPDTSLYSATKAAVRSFARTLAAEFAERKIRFNAISPGPIETPLFGKMGLPQEAVDEFGAHVSEQVPLKRFGQADEIAAAVAFLGSADASYVNGTELEVDGGLSQV
ncbi:hypothetical protein ABI59_23295 [Acidobacteria bacterium Mor1]|nr:hypothetical protein ABI59_23295 [Acidobacteria bacterium Mor1]